MEVRYGKAQSEGEGRRERNGFEEVKKEVKRG